jgi:DNA repair protein RecN (Recombination protein N)
MLRQIHIRDFAIVDAVDLELEAGMTALTGETGAGKSILLDALGLCLGDRADTSALPEQAERAEVVVTFDVGDNPPAHRWLVEQALDAEHECVLRRVIQRSGRSQSWINGRPAPLQSLAELGEHLVDIHGQHAHQSLLRRDAQRDTLDAFGVHAAAQAPVAETYRELRSLREEMRRLQGGSEGLDDRLDLLRFQVSELEALGMSADDIRELDAEQRRLASAGDTIERCQRALSVLYEDEPSAQALLSGVLRDLADRTDLSPELASAHDLFSEALVQVEEGCNSLRHFIDGMEVEPGRLEWVEERLATVTDLARKHRCDPEALPERLEALRAELEALENAGERLAELDRLLASMDARYREAATALSAARRDAAATLGAEVTALMHELGMPGGELIIAVEHDADGAPSAHGLDQVRFDVRTNPDQRPAPLARVASGGELSRIGLALQVATAHVTHIPTLIFDEADTGIGGAIAEVVGRKLRTLGSHHQVLCVTHLPQVAAQAHHQLKVAKGMEAGRTRTRISRLQSDERTREIARMLGGVEITDNTLNHAREMLARAG